MPEITKGQRVIISGSIIIVALLLEKLAGYTGISEALMAAAALIAGYPTAVGALRALRYKLLGIDALVTIAVVGALIIGEYWEAAAVTFLFMLGSYLESRTLEKTRSAIKSLLALTPDKARVIRDGRELELSPDEVIKKDMVIIRPGERIPVDGEVIEGSAYVNQAAITGEAMPISRMNGDSVFSGTVIESGYLKVRADRVGEDTTFARILQMVEEAQDKKAKTQKFLEAFARYYTPGIMTLTAGVFVMTRDVELALTLLVIACPGALVISAPVSIVAGIGNGAKHGVLVKGGEVIEKLGTVNVLAFDKTGTLTEGKPKVIDIRGVGAKEEEVLRLAAAAELYSEHPLSKAIMEEAHDRGLQAAAETGETEIIQGQGIKAIVEGRVILVGNRRLMEENGLGLAGEVEEYLAETEEEGQTGVIVGDRQGILGIISISDTLRKDAAELVRRLKAQRAGRLVMLTGDNSRAAAAIARKVGLDEYHAELLPEDKVKILKELRDKWGTTAMIGDGVNDAPALATADLGIAIGGVGSDVAMETADVVLMSEELGKVSYAMGLGKATVKNMKQNIYFAIIVVGLLLAGVLAKAVFLSFGMLVHELSVLIVIVNAIRLLKYREL